jgi:DNA-binding transcriptional LysR family regulator
MSRLDLRNFNLNLLLALDGLLRERSVSSAARSVRVTPSAMSHSLAELRDRLGDPLLIRSGAETSTSRSAQSSRTRRAFVVSIFARKASRVP